MKPSLLPKVDIVVGPNHAVPPKYPPMYAPPVPSDAMHRPWSSDVPPARIAQRKVPSVLPPTAKISPLPWVLSTSGPSSALPSKRPVTKALPTIVCNAVASIARRAAKPYGPVDDPLAGDVCYKAIGAPHDAGDLDPKVALEPNHPVTYAPPLPSLAMPCPWSSDPPPTFTAHVMVPVLVTRAMKTSLLPLLEGVASEIASARKVASDKGSACAVACDGGRSVIA